MHHVSAGCCVTGGVAVTGASCQCRMLCDWWCDSYWCIMSVRDVV